MCMDLMGAMREHLHLTISEQEKDELSRKKTSPVYCNEKYDIIYTISDGQSFYPR